MEEWARAEAARRGVAVEDLEAALQEDLYAPGTGEETIAPTPEELLAATLAAVAASPSGSASDDAQRRWRRAAVDAVRGSSALEGGGLPSPEVATLQEAYVAGRLSVEELVEATLRSVRERAAGG